MLKERQITDTRGISIDVHQAIEGFLVNSRLPVAPLFATPQTFSVRGVELQACSAAAMFVHSVLHSTSGGAQLSTLPDVGRLARLANPDDAIVTALLVGRSQRDHFIKIIAGQNGQIRWQDQYCSCAFRGRERGSLRQCAV